MKQLTEEQAIEMYDSGEWENWSDEQIAHLQLYQKRLCVPFKRFNRAMQAELERPIYTHEYAWIENLREEYEGKRGKPTMADIIDLIPPEKLIEVEI